MIFTIPNSLGTPLEEFNKCHDLKGRFCVTPEGNIQWEKSPDPKAAGVPGYLVPDVQKALDAHLAVRLEPGQGLLSAGFSKMGGVPRVTVAATDDIPKDSVLSALRHEVGHAQADSTRRDIDRTFRGHMTRPPLTRARTVHGNLTKRNLTFSDEFTAWKNAIRQSKTLRVNWKEVGYRLGAYAHREGLPNRTVTLAVKVLKRYARYGRSVRRRAA